MVALESACRPISAEVRLLLVSPVEVDSPGPYCALNWYQAHEGTLANTDKGSYIEPRPQRHSMGFKRVRLLLVSPVEVDSPGPYCVPSDACCKVQPSSLLIHNSFSIHGSDLRKTATLNWYQAHEGTLANTDKGSYIEPRPLRSFPLMSAASRSYGNTLRWGPFTVEYTP
jgi:hypothetical protein